MKILFLAKEFQDGEGITEYCKSVAEHLVRNNHDTSVVAFDDQADYSIDDRVDVRKVPLYFEGDNLYNWAMMLNNELKKHSREIIEEGEYDVIHANDWVTIPGAIALSRHLEIPLIVTVHSTENERGFGGEHAELISELEWQGTFEADKVLVTKEETKNSVLFDLDVPGEKVEVIDPYEPDWESRVLKQYRKTIKQEERKIAEKKTP